MAEQVENTPRAAGRKPWRSRPWVWVIGILVGIAVVFYIASFFLDEPLRRTTERKVNRDLKGYQVKIPVLHVQLIGLSLTLKGLTIIQEAHPNPPVAYFPYLKASIHWREILSGKLVAEFDLRQPNLHINLPQLEHETANKTPVKKRGWQQAVEDIYPLKINLLNISDASITYIDQDPKRPLVLSHLNITADNIRNIHLPDKVYPSPFHLDTVIFGTGHGRIDGRANFLAEPTPGVKGTLKLEGVPIDYFKPVIARSNLAISGGVLGGAGEFEYAPKVQVAHLKDVTIHGMNVEYIHTGETAAAEKRRAAVVGKTAKKLSNKPQVLISIDDFRLAGCTLGMLNDAGGKRYRVFISDVDFQLKNFSNQFTQGTAKATLHGKFMGSGITTVTGDFRPVKKSPDMDLYIKIDNTQLTSMNDLLRSYGNFDVAAGTFSLVTELHVKNNTVNGYIKPFFKDMKVYDRRKDKDKSLFHKLYEMLIGGVAKLLENRPRQQVATKADISGSLSSPQTSTMEIIVQLIKNAFIKAILPTFEHQVTTGKP
jgi:hypothetical protein